MLKQEARRRVSLIVNGMHEIGQSLEFGEPLSRRSLTVAACAVEDRTPNALL